MTYELFNCSMLLKLSMASEALFWLCYDMISLLLLPWWWSMAPAVDAVNYIPVLAMNCALWLST